MNPETIKSFWQKVDKSGTVPLHLPDIQPCWKWKAFKHKGYGIMRCQNPRGNPIVASRVSWMIHNGKIPHGKSVLHKCDNPECTNPTHLFLGTQKCNMDDRQKKDRQPKGESQGSSKLKASDIVQIKTSTLPRAALANMFGVGIRHIGRIQTGVAWSHIKLGCSR